MINKERFWAVLPEDRVLVYISRCECYVMDYVDLQLAMQGFCYGGCQKGNYFFETHDYYDIFLKYTMIHLTTLRQCLIDKSAIHVTHQQQQQQQPQPQQIITRMFLC